MIARNLHYQIEAAGYNAPSSPLPFDSEAVAKEKARNAMMEALAAPSVTTVGSLGLAAFLRSGLDQAQEAGAQQKKVTRGAARSNGSHFHQPTIVVSSDEDDNSFNDSDGLTMVLHDEAAALDFWRAKACGYDVAKQKILKAHGETKG